MDYFIIIALLIILYSTLLNKKTIATRKIIKKRKMEEKLEMIELAKKFIGKECIIYTFDSSHSFTGLLKEVSNGAILIEKDEQIEAINLDFILRIREYPRNKKGKKKSIVLD